MEEPNLDGPKVGHPKTLCKKALCFRQKNVVDVCQIPLRQTHRFDKKKTQTTGDKSYGVLMGLWVSNLSAASRHGLSAWGLGIHQQAIRLLEVG